MTQIARTHQLQNKLTQFRNVLLPKSVLIRDITWTYYDTGSHKFPLLLLSGGGGQAEAFFPQIQALSQKFRVIAPNIPSDYKQMQTVIDGLSSLLNALELSVVHVFASSLGGHIAQVFIRRHYGRVRDLVLSHSAIPTESLAQKTAMQYRMLQFYPQPLLARLFKRSLRKQIASSRAIISDAEREFWINYFDQQYDDVIQKRDILSRVAIAHDYFSNFTFHSTDLNYWDGRLLIIESSQDDVYSEGERGALISMYSRAWIHTFEGYRHMATVLAYHEMSELVQDFLKGDAYDGNV